MGKRATVDYESPKPKPDRFWWWVFSIMLASFMAGWGFSWLASHGFIDLPMR